MRRAGLPPSTTLTVYDDGRLRKSPAHTIVAPRVPEHTYSLLLTVQTSPPSVCDRTPISRQVGATRRFRQPTAAIVSGKPRPDRFTRGGRGQFMDEVSFTRNHHRYTASHFAATGNRSPAKRRPCVVMASGFASTRDTSGLVAYARGLRRGRIRRGVVRLPRFRRVGRIARQLVSASRQRQALTPRSPPPAGCRASTLSASCCGASRYSGGHVVASPPRTGASRR